MISRRIRQVVADYCADDEVDSGAVPTGWGGGRRGTSMHEVTEALRNTCGKTFTALTIAERRLRTHTRTRILFCGTPSGCCVHDVPVPITTDPAILPAGSTRSPTTDMMVVAPLALRFRSLIEAASPRCCHSSSPPIPASYNPTPPRRSSDADTKWPNTRARLPAAQPVPSLANLRRERYELRPRSASNRPTDRYQFRTRTAPGTVDGLARAEWGSMKGENRDGAQ